MPKTNEHHLYEIAFAAEELIQDFELPQRWDQSTRLSGDALIRLVDALDEYNEQYSVPSKPRYSYRTCYECGVLIPTDVHGLPPRTRSRWGLSEDVPSTFCPVCSADPQVGLEAEL